MMYEYKGKQYQIISHNCVFKQKGKEDIKLVAYAIEGDKVIYHRTPKEFNELFTEVTND